MKARVSTSSGRPGERSTAWTGGDTSLVASGLDTLRCRDSLFFSQSEHPPPATLCCPHEAHLRCKMTPICKLGPDGVARIVSRLLIKYSFTSRCVGELLQRSTCCMSNARSRSSLTRNLEEAPESLA